MNASKFIGYILLYAIGITLIIEGIFLNIISLISNNGLYLINGAGLIFLGAILYSAAKTLSKNLHKEE
ncbi:MAG: hypothetical protein ACP6IP_07085 [Candidatus Njordarchaeia archaeon]